MKKKPRQSPRWRTAAAMINIIHFFFNDRLPAGRIYVDNIIIFIIIIITVPRAVRVSNENQNNVVGRSAIRVGAGGHVVQDAREGGAHDKIIIL